MVVVTADVIPTLSVVVSYQSKKWCVHSLKVVVVGKIAAAAEE